MNDLDECNDDLCNDRYPLVLINGLNKIQHTVNTQRKELMGHYKREYPSHTNLHGLYVQEEIDVNHNGSLPNINCFYYRCLSIAERYPDKQFKITTCLGYDKDHVIEFGYLDRQYYYQIARFNNINDSEYWDLWRLDDTVSWEEYKKTIAGNLVRLPEKEKIPWYLFPLELLGLLS